MHAPLRAVWLLLVVLALSALGGSALAGPATEADRRVDAFLDETASLFGANEAAIVKAMGEPRQRQTMTFQSPHDDAPYEVISLTYDGLFISLYSMESGQRQFLHQIQVTSGPVCFARKICLGSPRERLASSLGEPEDREDTTWRYSDMRPAERAQDGP